MGAKIITIKRTKDFSLRVHWIYLKHKFHNLSWITEINELFNVILIYWDAPVYIWWGGGGGGGSLESIHDRCFLIYIFIYILFLFYI